jgi:alpha-L-fucosidase
VEAVYNSKRREDCDAGTCVLDLERGIVDKIWPNAWQTDTCIGNWHYDREAHYKSPKTVIDMLVDIVSRNGNLLLNFPLPNSGELDPEERKILAEITKWMAVNSEGIYSTRPWKIFGEGPGTAASAADARFNEKNRKPLTAQDVRFTTKGNILYAFCMGWPEKEAAVRPLGTDDKVENVELLGFKDKVNWTQDGSGLKIQMPPEKPSDYAITLKVTLRVG